MQQQTSLHIATPCHEDWNAMTPAGAGKFCASCSKQVVDFTLMSDTQILQFLAQQNGALCGRFDAGQLTRPLVEPAVSKKRGWYLALLLPFSLLFEKSSGQTGKRTVGKPAVRVEQKTAPMDIITMGLMLPPIVPEQVTLHGTLRDEKGNAVAYASIVEKGTSNGSVSDSAGRFSIKLRSKEDSVVLVASSVGYYSVEKKVSLAEADTNLMLTFVTADSVLEDVAVTSYGTQICRSMMGGITSYQRITLVEKRDSAVRKVLRLHTFTLYPNPGRSGSIVQINVKKKGDYELQLLSNSPALLKTEAIPVKSDNTTVPFQLPGNLAAGIYYLRLIDVNSKNSYLEKILVN